VVDLWKFAIVSMFKKLKIKEKKRTSSIIVPADKKEKGWFKSEGQLVVDVYETNSDFVVLAAIAGILAKDLDVLIENDMLIIKGERPNPQKSKEKNYFYQECYWGPFSRKIILPEGVDISQAESSIEKGILVIKIPKVLTKKKRKIIVEE